MITGLVASVALALLLAGCSHNKQQSEAKKISPNEIPPQVMTAAKARLPGAEVTSAERENENGAVVYDLELKQGGRKFEMDIKEDGTIMEIEKQIMNPDVPAAAMSAVKAKYPNATVKEVMEVNKVSGGKETPDHYEFTLMDGGKEKEVVVSLDGKSVQTEEEAEKAEKK